MINIAEKLKGCPQGTKLYSPLFGEVEFVRIDMGNHKFPIIVRALENGIPFSNVNFTAEGKWYNVEQSECLLFPSKDNRDWNEFNLPANTFKSFDKVLVRDGIDKKWIPSIFCCYEDEVDKDFPYVCLNGRYGHCIPYEGNEHLLNTTNTPKDY
jgi:hypothetical protein